MMDSLRGFLVYLRGDQTVGSLRRILSSPEGNQDVRGLSKHKTFMEDPLHDEGNINFPTLLSHLEKYNPSRSRKKNSLNRVAIELYLS